MRVSDKFWRKTKIGQILYLFPGQIGEFLQEGAAAQITQAEKFLPLIFFRWYFLESGLENCIPPYFFLEACRELEKWPKKGQFFPQASISSIGKELNVKVNVDYISYDEQPFLVDVKRYKQGEEAIYFFDQKYKDDIKSMARIVDKKEKDEKIVALYLEYLLGTWFNQDEEVNEAFEKDEWIDLWKSLLTSAGKKEGISTEVLLDRFVDKMRQIDKDFAMTSRELEPEYNEKGDSRYQAKSLQLYNFWLNLSFNLLIPLSCYMHLTAPVFAERENFRRDVLDLLSNFWQDPIPIHSPCSRLFLTNFGKMVFT